jgi:hypothetical protein
LTTSLAQLSLDVTLSQPTLETMLKRTICHVETQSMPEKSEHEVNTESFSFTNRGIIDSEAGLKDVRNLTDRSIRSVSERRLKRTRSTAAHGTHKDTDNFLYGRRTK